MKLLVLQDSLLRSFPTPGVTGGPQIVGEGPTVLSVPLPWRPML